MSKGYHPGRDTMPEQISEAIDQYERRHGVSPPVNQAEAYSRENSQETSHPHDSFLADANFGVLSGLEKDAEEEVELRADGGYAHERFFESVPEDVAETASEYGVDLSSYQDNLTAVRGGRGEVNEFVAEVRQDLGREVTEDKIERGIYGLESEGNDIETGKVAADGGSAFPSPNGSDPRYDESGEPFTPESSVEEGVPYGGFLSEVEAREEPGDFMGDLPM